MIKIGDIIRGEPAYEVVLGIVTGYWEPAAGIQQPLVLWLDGVYEGETLTALSDELEVIT